MRKRLNVALPGNVKIRTCSTDKRLIYHVKCPEEACTDEYIGESGRQVIEGVKYHNGINHPIS